MILLSTGIQAGPYFEKINSIVMTINIDIRPALRFLYFHFILTLIQDKTFRTLSYAGYMEELITGKPFTKMIFYLRNSLLLE